MQQALHLLSNHREPNLWFGIGLVYDSYSSLMHPSTEEQKQCLRHAEEAFSAVLSMSPRFERCAVRRLGFKSQVCRPGDPAFDPPSCRCVAEWQEVVYRLGLVFKALGNSKKALDCMQAILSNPPPPLAASAPR